MSGNTDIKAFNTENEKNYFLVCLFFGIFVMTLIIVLVFFVSLLALFMLHKLFKICLCWHKLIYIWILQFENINEKSNRYNEWIWYFQIFIKWNYFQLKYKSGQSFILFFWIKDINSIISLSPLLIYFIYK